MDIKLKEYIDLAKKSEDLKSEERVLETMRVNLHDMKQLLIETESKFCIEDQRLRYADKESLRERCSNLIDHLVHYKCVIECLATDTLNIDCNLLNDDEYVSFSLTYRQVELTLLQGIKRNQQRHEAIINLRESEASSFQSKIEPEWRAEHDERREFISRLILDQNQFVVDRTSRNLEQQQTLLIQRYQMISNLIKTSA